MGRAGSFFLYCLTKGSQEIDGKRKTFLSGIHEIDALINYLNQQNILWKRGCVLDFGCGPGRLSQALTRYFESVKGIDISESMINLANLYNEYPEKFSIMLIKTQIYHNFRTIFLM